MDKEKVTEAIADALEIDEEEVEMGKNLKITKTLIHLFS